MTRTDHRYDNDIDNSHAHTVHVPRTRGAVSGLLLIILGVWGALIPFVGPYFDYSYQNDDTWAWTAARFWLEVLPGGAAVLGGLLLLVSANRITGSLGGWLAALGGAWYVVGQTLSSALNTGSVGTPTATTDAGRTVQQLGFFYGLGALILFLGSFALGRLSVVGVRDVRVARKRHDRAAAVQVTEPPSAGPTRAGPIDDRVPAETPMDALAQRPVEVSPERPIDDRPGR
jgi:hypothetical protein